MQRRTCRERLRTRRQRERCCERATVRRCRSRSRPTTCRRSPRRARASSPTSPFMHVLSCSEGYSRYTARGQGNDKFFYGTAYQGGSIGYGSIYRIDAAGSLTTLHSFNYGDGANPFASLLLASDGFFYGTT